MPITIITSGPTEEVSSAIDTSEPTFASMATAIADDVDDTTGEYAVQIRTAILSALRYCERENFYFNETRDVTFSTVNGQEWYGAADNANIPTLIRIEAAFSEDASGQRSEIRRTTPQELEYLSDNTASRGEPYAFTYFNRQIRLYPIPSDYTYTIRLQVSPYRLAPLTTDTDTNAWFTEAYDMVKARAKYILAKDTLKDAEVAAEALNDYTDQLAALRNETSRRTSTGFIRATCF